MRGRGQGPCEAAAVGLRDEFASRADEMDRVGRMPADLAAATAGAGLFRMLVPSDLGGPEADPVDALRAIELLGAANGSAGWCVMISATTSLMAGWLPENRAAEVFGDPAGCWGGAYAPSGRALAADDGLHVTGRWAWGSGSENCTWFAGGAIGDDGVFRLCYLPASEVTIHPNWDVVGLRGTGSHDWSVDDAVVPVDRCVDLLCGSPVHPSPLYRIPLFGMLAAGVAAVGLGVASAAVDALVELAGGKVPSLATRRLADRTTIQAEVSRRVAALDAARTYLHATIAAALDGAAAGDDPTDVERAQLRMAAVHAAHTAADVTTAMYTLGGGTSVRNDSPLPRLHRDAHVVTQHLMVSPSVWEPCGKALLGLALERMDL